MIELWNTMKGAGVAAAHQLGQNRWGTITAVKKSDNGYEAKIMLQPEGIVSGWLPVLSHSVGSGWGIVAPPMPGTQAFVAPDSGDGHHGVIIGVSFSQATVPPVPTNGFDQTDGMAVEAGEMALVSKAGSVIRLCTDGSVYIKAPTMNLEGDVNVRGNLTVQGDVSVQASPSGALGKIDAANDIHSGADISDVHGTVDAVRSTYNIHHHGSGAGPTPTVPE